MKHGLKLYAKIAIHQIKSIHEWLRAHLHLSKDSILISLSPMVLSLLIVVFEAVIWQGQSNWTQQFSLTARPPPSPFHQFHLAICCLLIVVSHLHLSYNPNSTLSWLKLDGDQRKWILFDCCVVQIIHLQMNSAWLDKKVGSRKWMITKNAPPISIQSKITMGGLSWVRDFCVNLYQPASDWQ